MNRSATEVKGGRPPAVGRRRHGADDVEAASMSEHNPRGRTVAIMAATTVAVGISNYGMTLAMANLLSASEFSRFAAGQGLLLVLGTGSMAALPWAVARYLASEEYEGSRAKAMAFGLAGSLVQAVVLGGVALVIGWMLAGPAYGFVCASATATISMLAGPTGYLQGTNRLSMVALSRAAETAVRIVVSCGLVWLGAHTATAVLVGFPAGGVVALALLIWLGRTAYPVARMERSTVLRLGRQAAGLGAVQLLFAAVSAADTVYVEAGHYLASESASYQSAALLGRIPLFVSAAISIASYTALVAARTDTAATARQQAGVRMFAWLCLPFVAACVTVPAAVLEFVIPPEFGETQMLLRLTCLTGCAAGWLNIVTTTDQARGRFTRPIVVLSCAAVAQAVALLVVGHVGSVTVFAAASLALLLCSLVWLLQVQRRHERADREETHPAPRQWVLAVVVVVALAAAGLAGRSSVPLWLIVMLAITCGSLLVLVPIEVRRRVGHHLCLRVDQNRGTSDV